MQITRNSMWYVISIWYVCKKVMPVKGYTTVISENEADLSLT